MSHQISRRDFLKISASTIVSAGLLGVGLNKAQNWFETPNTVSAKTNSVRPLNVIWIVLDTVRAASMSLYGYGRGTTPNLERLARFGANFEQAISPASWTLQSHASLFTGRNPFDLSADWDVPLDNTYPTLAELFRLAGYETAGFVANYFFLSPSYGINRGFDYYESFRLTPGRAFLGTAIGDRSYKKWRLFDKIEKNDSFGNKNAEMMRENFLGWLNHRQKNSPFFAFINFIDAHAPYLPPGQFVARFTNNQPIGYLPISPEQRKDPKIIRGLQDSYDGEIAYLDDQLGKLVDELVKQDLLRNTLLVITSDHGEHFGEHDLLDHGNSCYLPVLHVPLLMICPDLIPVSTIKSPVSSRNLAATIVDLAKLSDERIPGNSLVRHWSSSNPISEMIRSESTLEARNKNNEIIYSRSTSLLKDNLHYIHSQNGREELFDIRNDPGETVTLVSDQRYKSDLEAFRIALKERIDLS